MVERVGLVFFAIINLVLCRQVPGLRSRVSKHKKRTEPDVRNRTRPTPADRIFAQRARRAEVGAGNQEEDHHQRQQQPHSGSLEELRTAQCTSRPQADSNRGRPALPVPAQQVLGEADDQDVVYHQDQCPFPVQPAHQAPHSTSTIAGDEYFRPGSSQQAAATQPTQLMIRQSLRPEAPGTDAENEAPCLPAQKEAHFRSLSPLCPIVTNLPGLQNSQLSKRRVCLTLID